MSRNAVLLAYSRVSGQLVCLLFLLFTGLAANAGSGASKFVCSVCSAHKAIRAIRSRMVIESKYLLKSVIIKYLEV